MRFPHLFKIWSSLLNYNYGKATFKEDSNPSAFLNIIRQDYISLIREMNEGKEILEILSNGYQMVNTKIMGYLLGWQIWVEIQKLKTLLKIMAKIKEIVANKLTASGFKTFNFFSLLTVRRLQLWLQKGLSTAGGSE